MRLPRSQPFIPSPVKRRDPRKTKITVEIKTNQIKSKKLRAELLKLTEQRAQRRAQQSKPQVIDETIHIDTAEGWIDVDMEQEPAPIPPDAQLTPSVEADPQVVNCHPPSRRTVPDKATTIQYDKWMSLLPKLQPFYLQQLSQTTGIPSSSQPILFSCSSPKCTGMKTAKVLCLFLDCKFCQILERNSTAKTDFEEKTVPFCRCHSLPVVLVQHGLFPSAPQQPRIAFSMILLDFYQALFERACNAVNAFSSALQSFYERRGFYIQNQQVCANVAYQRLLTHH